MNKYELIKMHRSLLEVLSANDIKTTDVSFIDAYADYVELRKKMKYSAVISELSTKYGKSERTISRAIARLHEEVTT